MKSKLSALTVAATFLMISASVNAAHFGSGIEQTTEELRQEASEQIPKQEAQAKKSQENVVSKSADKVVDSDQMAQAFVAAAQDNGALSEGLGWNEKESTYVAIGTAVCTADSASPDFIKLRAVKAIEASLSAKRDIIEFVRTDLSTENVITLPETGLDTEFDKKLVHMKAMLEERTRAYEQAVKAAGLLQKDAVLDIKLEDLLKEGISEGLRIGSQICEEKYGFKINLDLAKLEAKQAARIKSAQEALLSLQAEIDGIKTEYDKLKGQLSQVNNTTIETFSKMPLVGATTIGQWESFIDGQYSISVVVTWSPNQERMVHALLNGESITLDRKGPRSLGDYIRMNDWSTAIGGRKYLDDKGVYSVIGIGSWPLIGKSSKARREAEGFATSLAQQSVALAFKGDIEAKRVAEIKAQEYGTSSMSKTEVASSLAETLKESVKNIQLQGLSRRFKRVLQHPISGQDMAVVIMSMDVNSSVAAKNMEKTNMDSASSIERENLKSIGTKAGMDESYQSSKSDSSAYADGVEQSRASKGNRDSSPQANSSSKQNRGEQKKSVRGAGTTTDAFLY